MQSFNAFFAAVFFVIAILALGYWQLVANRRRRERVILTGLKAVDLLVPLPRGGDIEISGGKGTGSFVLTEEITCRLLSHPFEQFHVVCYLDENLMDLAGHLAEIEEILPKLKDRQVVDTLSEDALERKISSVPLRNIVIVVFSGGDRFLQQARDAIRRCRDTAGSSKNLTAIIHIESSAFGEFDSRVVCSRRLVEHGVYPAIDPEFSQVGAGRSFLNQNHFQIASATTAALIALLRTMPAGAVHDAKWFFGQQPEVQNCLRALRFLSQNFFTAEIYTGKKPSWIALNDTLRWFDDILAGRCSKDSFTKFMYCDSLPKNDS